MRSTYDYFTRSGVVFVTDRDEGGRSVTNDIENVVSELIARGVLRPGYRLTYRDSMGVWDEVVLDGHCRFVGFRSLNAGTPEEAREKMQAR